MISIIYAGNRDGVCAELFKNIRTHINFSQTVNVIDLQCNQYDFRLTQGYHQPLSETWKQHIQIMEQSDTLIFIYPLYWFNMPMLLKGFVDTTFWPDYAFSFKDKKFLKNGLWKDKKAIIIYTLGGSEWFHRLNKRLGYRVLKYPLNISGIFDITTFYIDNLNRSATHSTHVQKRINTITHKVTKLI
ncbi:MULTISPECIES: NAD(P)H-dependent oxidoreductase [Staphylococcus]|uniref:NAD(P)H-dependent oxidoreductase n=1 Tax=Staphylococcus hsinchuensis TaxID=3051183 RepID=A0ABZ3EF46_9STAP|nr:NAD(P)H-dependent oxidoreductase [Staphylococcus sp. Marseille-Q6910]